MLINALEVPCTFYLYPSKLDPENLYNATKSFVLPFGRVVTIRGFDSLSMRIRNGFTNPIIMKNQLTLWYTLWLKGTFVIFCWIIGVVRGYYSVIVDQPTPGEIYTFDKCQNYIEIMCDYLYPSEE